MWTFPASFTSRPAALTPDQLVERYEALTGIGVRHRDWYRAFAGFKLAVITLVGAMLFDSGVTDDVRMANMGFAVHLFSTTALRELGITEPLDAGPVTARPERLRALRQ
jgi:hypothetical protein